MMCRCVLCSGVANCPELGLVMIAALIIFSQFLRGVGLPKCLPVIGGWADLLAPHPILRATCLLAPLCSAEDGPWTVQCMCMCP